MNEQARGYIRGSSRRVYAWWR